MRGRAWVACAVSAPVVLTVGVWIVTLLLAERAVGRSVAAAGSLGVALDSNDLHIRSGGSANAVPILRDADAAAALTPAQDKLSTDLLDDVMRPAQLSALRALVQSKVQALDLSRNARAVGAVDWSLLHTRYVGHASIPVTSYQWRPQSQVLYDAAWLAHYDGDDATAVESIRDLLFESRAMADHPLMNSHVWAGFTSDMAVKLVEEAHDLRVGTGGGAASAGQVRALIDDLLDEAPVRRAYANHMRWERAYWLEHAGELGRANPLYRPILRRDAARVIEVYNGILDAVDEPTWPAAKGKMPGYQARPPTALPMAAARYAIDTVDEMARPVSVTYSAQYSGPSRPREEQVEQMFYHLAYRRMAGVVVAIGLYRADHGGALPATLEALVPRYLARVPADPFAADGSAVRYPTYVTPPRVYCIGGNCKDDAAARGIPPRYASFFGRYFELDVALHMGRPTGVTPMVPAATRPATGQSTKRGGGDAEVTDQPGDAEQDQRRDQGPDDGK